MSYAKDDRSDDDDDRSDDDDDENEKEGRLGREVDKAIGFVIRRALRAPGD